MKYFVIFLILIGFAGLIVSIGFAQNSYALSLGMSSEQILETQKLVILGHVDSVETKHDKTEYLVNVLEYVKFPDEFEKKHAITVVGCAKGQRGGCTTFDKGHDILFVLDERDGVLQVSEFSFVAPNPNCTVNELFELHDANDGLETSQNNQTKQFFTDKPINITFYAYNKQLDNSTYNVTVEFFRANNNTVFSKTFEGNFEDCVPNVKLETVFTPVDMGTYGKRYTASYGRGELLWGFPIVEKGATPHKQINSGISVDKIQCKETLLLIKKHDGTPMCVTPETREKLIERGWSGTLYVAVNRDAPSIYLGPTDIPSANNQFALNFYSHVTQDKKTNVFFSPTSIFTAFAIAYEGAKDNTASEIKDVFGFEPDESKRRMDFADMQSQLNMKQQNNTISLANALWIAENFEVLPEYVDAAKTYYGSNVESVNFSSKEKGIDLINSWIDEKTHGKIEKIFEELNPATKLVITNAIYFKGIWEEPFDKTKTTVGDFHVSSDSTVQVPMMESKTTFPNVAVNDLVQIVELPYEGEKFSMLILLPRDVDGMKSLEESLSVDNLTKWKGELQKIKTKVYMPKFKLETEYDLKSVLQEMGIHDAFNDADFTGIANSGLYIEKAVHKAFVEVNEEGTEAAAATGIAMFQSGPFEFTVDRPFIFIIQDNETESILFIGKVVDPLQ